VTLYDQLAPVSGFLRLNAQLTKTKRKLNETSCYLPWFRRYDCVHRFRPNAKLTTLLSASEAWKDVRRAIDKGNAQWSEGWAKGDPAMVAAIFADDGVQLAGNGKIFKGPQQISEHQKAAMQGVDPGVKVTVTTVTVWVHDDTAY